MEEENSEEILSDIPVLRIKKKKRAKNELEDVEEVINLGHDDKKSPYHKRKSALSTLPEEFPESEYYKYRHTDIILQGVDVPICESHLTFEVVSEMKHYMALHNSAGKTMDRYRLFGESALGQIDSIFEERRDERIRAGKKPGKNHWKYDDDQFYNILLTEINPNYVPEDGDFLSVVQKKEWRIDLTEVLGTKVEQDIRSITNWESRWSKLSKDSRKKVIEHINSTIGHNLGEDHPQFTYIREVQLLTATENHDYDIKLFFKHNIRAAKD